MEASQCVLVGCYVSGDQQFAQEMKNGGDHFIVEDLLDFSNEEEDTGTHSGVDRMLETAAENSSDSSTVTTIESCNSSSVGDNHFSGELCEPYDDLVELEWLSNFVEDSFSSEDLQKLQLISGVIKPGSCFDSGTNSGSSSSETRYIENPTNPSQFFLPEASPFPAKARSKRSRAAPNSWSSRLLVLPPSDSDSDSVLLIPNPVRKTPKPSKKKEPGLLVSDGRKCLHCATDKTPQWRTGPMGPKTLCNACGVRYKSGRLVPEYRPASSPTFVLSKHSNSHRKVLELRKQKEMQMDFGFEGVPKGVMGHGDDDGFLIHHHLGPQII